MPIGHNLLVQIIVRFFDGWFRMMMQLGDASDYKNDSGPFKMHSGKGPRAHCATANDSKLLSKLSGVNDSSYMNIVWHRTSQFHIEIRQSKNRSRFSHTTLVPISNEMRLFINGVVAFASLLTSSHWSSIWICSSVCVAQIHCERTLLAFLTYSCDFVFIRVPKRRWIIHQPQITLFAHCDQSFNRFDQNRS